MAVSVYFNNQGATREQFLVEDLIIESIKNHGIDIYYIPRDSQSSIDELFGDDPVKSFTHAYKIEMYLETFNDFTGNQEFFSKFGLEIQKDAKVAVARRTFEKYNHYGGKMFTWLGDDKHESEYIVYNEDKIEFLFLSMNVAYDAAEYSEIKSLFL